jgi:hypothetical protein
MPFTTIKQCVTSKYLQLKWVHSYSSVDQGLTLTTALEWLRELDLTFVGEWLEGNSELFLRSNI